jgi:tetratricopeptide (TPR) repeat protein
MARVDQPITAPAIPTQQEMLELLGAGNYAELDRRYGAIQRAYESQAISDEELRASFRVFYLTDPALALKYDAWVSGLPRSYVAHLARGIYYDFVGAERRGGGSVEETSAEQFRGMEEAFAIATEDLRISLSLTQKPLLSYLYWIEISRYAGSQGDTDALFERALRVDPRTVIVREMYMVALQTKWGGGQEAMHRFLDSCREAGLSDAHLRRLESVIAEDRAWIEYFQQQNYSAAAQDYIQAYELSGGIGCLHCAADAFLAAGDFGSAIDTYSRSLSIDPEDAYALYRRGWLYMNHQRAADGVADFQRAANLGDPRGEESLARLFLTGNSVPEDRARGLELLEAAADQGYLPAQRLLVQVKENIFPLPAGPNPGVHPPR